MHVVLAVALLALSTPLAAAQEPQRYEGLLLSEALQALQATGIRVVFTSTIVTPDMRVRSEPRAATARQRLDELLGQHGLTARAGPAGILQVVRAEPVAKARGRPAAAAIGAIEGRVVHAVTGGAIADGFVQIDDGAKWDTSADANGRFLLRRVDAGVRTIRVSAPGHAPAAREILVAPGRTAAVTIGLSPRTGTHTEHVVVSGDHAQRQDRGVASETSIDRSQLASLHGVAGDDPFRAVHALPGVSAFDDFRSEFAVRGSPYRHVEVVIDGVATPWLRHTAYGRGPSGSITMLTGQVLDEVTLQAGAYPHRYSERLGAQLELVVREGSRANAQLRGAIGGTNVTVVGEGPLGRSARGSWLLSARQSYLEWPSQSDTATRTAFGFSDAAAKVVYDVRPNQQVGLTVLGGITAIDDEDNPANGLGEGTNRTSMVNLAWRSTFGSGTVLRQRAYVVRHQYLNNRLGGEPQDRGDDEEMAYRADVMRPVSRGVLEAGAQAGRIASRYTAGLVASRQFSGAAAAGSTYAHFAWAAAPTLTLSPGLRVTTSGLMARPTITRWMLGEWAFRPQWSLTASAGLAYQRPEPQQVFASAESTSLRPERALYADVSIEQRLAASVRWRATVFNRAERDILREPDLHPRLVGDRVFDPANEYSNALRGSAHGVEVLVDRRASVGLIGWVAYSYGRTRYTDSDRHETFWADLDQRHALNVQGAYRLSARTSVAATFRAGANFPIPAYLSARDGRLFMGNSRNDVRLPAYARLDIRGERAFDYHGRRLTLFGEVLNVLNRTNVGLGDGSISPLTGEAIGFTDTLLPRSGTVGIRVEF